MGNQRDEAGEAGETAGCDDRGPNGGLDAGGLAGASDDRGPTWVRTADGSYTARERASGELYHSAGGAWSECHEVYVEPFLAEVARLPQPLPRWAVLDVGFGLGLNWLAIANVAAREGRTLQIVSLERDPSLLQRPLPGWVLAEVGPSSAGAALDRSRPSAALLARLETLKRERNLAVPGLEAELWLGDAATELGRRLDRYEGAFDLVMHDAFSPRQNPECWDESFLRSLARVCKIGGLLLSFSVASRVRRSLQELGFDVRKAKGFARKRERLWARKVAETRREERET